MKKYQFVLIIVMAIGLLASCATPVTEETQIVPEISLPAPVEEQVAVVAHEPEPEVLRLNWDISAYDFINEEHLAVGDKRTIVFEPHEPFAGNIWGTDIYTDDSQIGLAAVHAGVISFEAGGVATFEVMEGQSHFAGSEQNGVYSSEYDEWPAAFRFVQ